MCITNFCELYIELATDVFKSQNPFLLKSLTDFLTGLPTSGCGKDILMGAFHQLAMTDSESCQWLLENSSVLLPEIDFEAQAIELARTLLLTKGFRLGADFSIRQSRRIILRDQIKAELLSGRSLGDRALLEQVLVTHDFRACSAADREVVDVDPSR